MADRDDQGAGGAAVPVPGPGPDRPAAAGAPGGRPGPPGDGDVAAFLAAAHRGDVPAAADVVQARLGAGEGLVEVLERVVCGAQEEVGRLWERDEWSVAEEHLATAVAEEVVSQVTAGAGRGGGGERRGLLVAACVEGEWHSLALRVVAVACRLAGWDVELLGPSVPIGHLVRHLHDRGPDGLVLSCAVPAHLVAVRRTCEAARGAGTPVLAGGRAFGADERRAVAAGADRWAPRPSAIPAALVGWTGVTAPPAPLDHPRLAEHVAVESDLDRLVAAAGGPAEEVRALLLAVSAALLVDDRGVVDEQVAWTLSAGGDRRDVAAAALAAARAAVRHDLPVAAEWLAGAGR